MNRSRRLLQLLGMLLPTSAVASSDVVLDWNEIALARVVASAQLPPDGARTMAMVHRHLRPCAFGGNPPGAPLR